MDTSPAQRFFDRRCKTLLPTTEGLLEPNLAVLLMLVSCLIRRRGKGDSTVASALLRLSSLVKLFVCGSHDEPGLEAFH